MLAPLIEELYMGEVLLLIDIW